MPPLWLVALIVAAAAPFCAAALQALLESKLRRRTSTTLARAFSTIDRQKPRREDADSREGERQGQPGGPRVETVRRGKAEDGR
jgi:hypothetical protein